MRLTLSILTGPEDAPGDSRVFTSGTSHIGRAPDNDWVLPDPRRHLSKRHCSVAFRDGFWTITDLSTNGTFLNDERDPIGHAGVHDLCDGDRIRLGSYEIAVSIAPETAAADKLAYDRLADDPPSARPRSFDQSRQGGFGTPVRDRFEAPIGQEMPLSQPVAPVALGRGFGPDEPFDGPVQPDHAPGIEDAFPPPKPVVLLDEDWDLSEPLEPESGPAIKPELAPDPRPAPAVSPAADDNTLLAAFLRGAGMPDAKPADPVAAMESLGAAFRALTSGLRETLMARAVIKSEFRIEQTMIRAQGNNPLKFSAGDEDALLALLGAGRRTEMAPAQAVTEAFRDIRMHELATMAAMQSAVRGTLRELEPARLRDGAAGGLLGAQRKVRAWDAFEAAHARMTQAMSDSFDSAFGKAFAKAYEQALREIRPERR